jgi:hypothetical protein
MVHVILTREKDRSGVIALLLAQPLITQTSHFNPDTFSHRKLIFSPS